MSDNLMITKPVRVWFRPYSHHDVQELLKKACVDFGRPGRRWRYRSPEPLEAADEPNAWCLDFYFANPHDAIMFGLKYLK